jgi:hypothetical protein
MTRNSPTNTRSSAPARALEFFGKFSLFGLTVGSHRSSGGTDGSSIAEPTQERYDCGGFNEAFIMQHWASYNLH